MNAGRSGGSVVLHVSAASHVGQQRKTNEDSLLVADLSQDPWVGGTVPPVRSFDAGAVLTSDVGPKGFMMMVADGMGGARAGEIASRMAVDGVYKTLLVEWAPETTSDPESIVKCLADAISRTNRRIFDAAQSHPEYVGMGTTATVCCLLDDRLFLAQVGDSRAYLIRQGRAIQITRDQSVVQHLVSTGRLSEEEAARSRGRNILLQALGTVEQVDVDLTHQSLRLGDHVVLCSDGLSGLVQADEISAVLQGSADPGAACSELVELANARGGPDNITVIIARAEGSLLQPPASDDPVGHFSYPFDDV